MKTRLIGTFAAIAALLATAMPTAEAVAPAPAPTPARVISAVGVGRGPSMPVVSGSRVFVANAQDGTLSVLDRASGKVTTSIPVGAEPQPPLATGGRLWLSLAGENRVLVLDAETLATLASIPVGGRPLTPVLAGAGQSVVVANSASDSVSILDATRLWLNGNVSVGVAPGVPMTGTGNQYQGYVDRVFVANSGSASVSIVDVLKREVVGTVAVGENPQDVMVSPPLSGTSVVYAPNKGSGTTTVFTQDAGAVVGTIPGEAGSTTPTTNVDGSIVFIPNSAAGTVTVFDAYAFKVLRTLRVGREPSRGVLSADDAFVFMPNRGSGTVSIINADKGTLTAMVRVGRRPTTPAVAGSTLYVSNEGSGTVSIVDVSKRFWPTAPRAVKARALKKAAAVRWSTPSSAGAASITSYVVTASTGQTCRTTKRGCIVRGLKKGAKVSFEVRASTRLAIGAGANSSAVKIK